MKERDPKERMCSFSFVFPRDGYYREAVVLLLVIIIHASSFLALTEAALVGGRVHGGRRGRLHHPVHRPDGPAIQVCWSWHYPACYLIWFRCPAQCPTDCIIDCASCRPVCHCDRPGGACQDPRFVGGDGITFYFHGKKDKDFCLVSDANLHINAHFIGKRVAGLSRDFTWVQSIAVLFDDHQIFVGANKVARWEDDVDQLALAFDGQPIFLPNNEGASWEAQSVPMIISRTGKTNEVMVEVKSSFKVYARVVPITDEESRIHRYEITDDDCLAHLDLTFKFFSLTEGVTGVLGQTYAPNYKSRVNISAPMPVLGGDRNFATSGLFEPDCAVSMFRGSIAGQFPVTKVFEDLECGGGGGGRGIVCKK